MTKGGSTDLFFLQHTKTYNPPISWAVSLFFGHYHQLDSFKSFYPRNGLTSRYRDSTEPYCGDPSVLLNEIS